MIRRSAEFTISPDTTTTFMSKPRCDIAAAIAALSTIAAIVSGISCAPRQTRPLSVSAKFDCLWWSEDEMQRLDPNSPPPMTARVELKRWESSDPVGTPHPETIDLAVDIRNDSSNPTLDLAPSASIQWLRGPIADRNSARWEPLELFPGQPLVRIAPGESRTVRIHIAVAKKMAALHDRKLDLGCD